MGGIHGRFSRLRIDASCSSNLSSSDVAQVVESCAWSLVSLSEMVLLPVVAEFVVIVSGGGGAVAKSDVHSVSADDAVMSISDVTVLSRRHPQKIRERVRREKEKKKRQFMRFKKMDENDTKKKKAKNEKNKEKKIVPQNFLPW